MTSIELIGTALGLGFLSGIRLYATVLILGLMVHSGLAPAWMSASEVSALTNPWVLGLAAVAAAAEFIADKVMWFDSLWDSFHSFIRPIGAAVLASEAFGSLDPGFKLCLVLLCGSMALTSHGSKAANRLVVNHSPEPFSNIVISILEDSFIPFGLWLLLKHPLVVLALALTFLAFFAWLTPKVFRLMRLQLAALRAWIGGWHSNRPDPGWRSDLTDDVAALVRVIGIHATSLPESLLRIAAPHLDPFQRPVGLRVAAGRSLKGMAHYIGYLAAGSGELVFVTRRGFRDRTHRIPFNEIDAVEWKRGMLMHRLTLRTRAGERSFFIFKDVDIDAASAIRPAPSRTPGTGSAAHEVRPSSKQADAPPPFIGAPPVVIVCVDGPVKGFAVPIPADGLLIGRDPKAAHLIVDAPEVSSCHVRIGRDGTRTGVWIEDLNSTNGTYYKNGSSVWMPLRGRQRLTVGSSFRLSERAAEFRVNIE